MRGFGVGAHHGIHTLDHAAQQVRVYGADDGILRVEDPAINRLDDTRRARCHVDARDLGVGDALRRRAPWMQAISASVSWPDPPLATPKP